MILVEELWTPKDQQDLDLCIGAVANEDLDRALLALESADDSRQREAEKTLRRWAAQLPAGAEGSPASQVEALRALLVDQLGFTGSGADVTDPRNSQLSEVMARRRGRPVLLSAVWMIVGRAAGFPVAGIGLPGRFLVRVGGDEGIYVDPFDGGPSLTETECRQRAEQLFEGELQWQESLLDPVSAPELLTRAAQGLATIYANREENGARYRTLRFMEAMRPSEPSIPLARAQLAEQVGAFPRAIKIYRAIAQQFEDTEAATEANEKLEQLSRLPIAKG